VVGPCGNNAPSLEYFVPDRRKIPPCVEENLPKLHISFLFSGKTLWNV
jgi:hypothetical protein